MWREALLMVYLLGIVFFFLRNVWSLTRMLRLIKGSTLVRQENGGHVLEEHPHRTDLQTIGIKTFNDLVAADNRVEKVILPLRDGLTIIRKK